MEQKTSCPLCSGEMNWILSVKISDTESNEQEWHTTYGCDKKCTEPSKIFFGEKKNG